MLQLVEAALYVYLAYFDAQFTERKLSELGVEAELNPLIRMLCRRFGIEVGVPIGIAIPSGLLLGIAWFYPQLLAFLLGIRFCLFLFQTQANTKP